MLTDTFAMGKNPSRYLAIIIEVESFRNLYLISKQLFC